MSVWLPEFREFALPTHRTSMDAMDVQEVYMYESVVCDAVVTHIKARSWLCTVSRTESVHIPTRAVGAHALTLTHSE